jgi:hypothetical protein
MGKRRSENRPLTWISAFGTWSLSALLSLLFAAAAVAEPLGEITGAVEEAAAPVTKPLETVAPPPVTTPAAPAPSPLPPVPVPEVKVPEAPVRVPSQPAPSAPAAANVPSPPTVAETAKHATQAVTGTAKGAAGAVQKTANTVTAAADSAARTSSMAESEAAKATQPSLSSAGAGDANSAAGMREDRPGDRGPAVTPNSPVPLASIAAGLLHPFIHVWPAVALVAEGPLRNFLGRWSQAVFSLFERNGSGSAQGYAAVDSGGTGQAAQPSPASTSSPPPTPPPFNWIGGETALPMLILFLVIAGGTLTILALMRRELGLSAIPRRMMRRLR